MHILLFGDFPVTLPFLKTLSEGNHTTATAATLDEALEFLEPGHKPAFHAVMLSDPLPVHDAVAVIRAATQLPLYVVFDKPPGLATFPSEAWSGLIADHLEAGADDIFAHWMSKREILARLNAVVWRYAQQVRPRSRFGDLYWDASNSTLSRNGDSLVLSRNLASIYELLLRAAPNMVSHEKLMQAAGTGKASFNVHIHNLRKQIHGLKSKVTIGNIQRRGFRLVYPEN